MARTGFEPPTLSLVDKDLSNWATRSIVLHTMITVNENKKSGSNIFVVRLLAPRTCRYKKFGLKYFSELQTFKRLTEKVATIVYAQLHVHRAIGKF